MALDLLEPNLESIESDGRNARRFDSRGLAFDVLVKLLQRDDPLRRSLLQKRWHRQPTSASVFRVASCCNLERSCGS